jgi:FkbH-like protein
MRLGRDVSFSQLIEWNRAHKRPESLSQVHVLANISIHPIKDVLEYSLRSRGINAEVTISDTTDPVLGAYQARADVVIVFYELLGITNNVLSLSQETFRVAIHKAEHEIAAILETLRTKRMVMLNELHPGLIRDVSLRHHNLSRMCSEFNEACRRLLTENTTTIDSGTLMGMISETTFDPQIFAHNRSIYGYRFFRRYSEHVGPRIAAIYGKVRKVLAMDCDFTLWRGLVAEDGATGVTIYEDVQRRALSLAERGVLLCLCSKNNISDIREMLDGRMPLRKEHVVAMAVNWRDKASNLRALAEELNLGLDSFIFIDDSEVELGWVDHAIPQVATALVPKDYSEYLALWSILDRELSAGPMSSEDVKRITYYRTESFRSEFRQQFGDVRQYLASLDIAVSIHRNEPRHVDRVAQLTQRTNQFNLTSKRLSSSEVAKILVGNLADVLSIEVSDKFGSYGIAGVVMIERETTHARIPIFVLSCRVLGREVERWLIDYVVDYVRAQNIRKLRGTLTKTPRNSPVHDFYANAGFFCINQIADEISYELDVESYKPGQVKHIRQC